MQSSVTNNYYLLLSTHKTCDQIGKNKHNNFLIYDDVST